MVGEDAELMCLGYVCSVGCIFISKKDIPLFSSPQTGKKDQQRQESETFSHTWHNNQKNVDAPVFVTATKSWDALKPAWPALHKIKISACHSWSRLASHHLPCLSLEASAPTPTEQLPVTGTAARNPSHAKHVNLQNHPHQYLPHGTCQPI